MKKKAPVMDRIDLDYSVSPAESMAGSIIHMIGLV